VCASCYTCTVRCPRGVKIAEAMLSLRRMSFEKNWIMPGEKLVFHKSFLKMVKERRKISELSLGLTVNLRSFPPAHPMEDAILLLKLLRRGKLR
jgi:heterodisulfide reductase subunit C